MSGGGGGGMPCEQSSPQFVFQYFSNPIHNYWICCRFKVTSTCKGEGDIWCDYNTVPLFQV